jgi:5'-phosphate synthase pdxT subunit
VDRHRGRPPLLAALATAFHPELTGDRRIHELFVNIVRHGS